MSSGSSSWSSTQMFPDSGSPIWVTDPATQRRQTSARLAEVRKSVALRELVQTQGMLLDATRDLAIQMWCSFYTTVSPNWIVQIHLTSTKI